MRHLGMLEGQIMAAMGVRPKWDEGGRVVGMEAITAAELGRPRIDPVISITGLYRDQFPNVMERINEGLLLVAALDEPAETNPIRSNSRRIEADLVGKGADPVQARNFSLTRIFGNESGNYGTGLPDATLKSGNWDEKDGKLAEGYLGRMSWAFGPDTSAWSEKLRDGQGAELNVYAAQLSGTDAAVFSRSSNLRGMLDTDHPFEYLGGISLAIRHIDGTSPQLYISNMRDPQRAKLETAERFMANELRAVYQHPRWIKEMQKEGYAGTLKMLDVVNNFWGWQAVDRNVVRDDQWQEFHESYVNDRYQLGMRAWFEQSNPTALAQITERMLEAIRKDYWKTDDATKRQLVETYREIAQKHDVVTSNETFKTYVAELAQGFGLADPAAPVPAALEAPVTPPEPQAAPPPTPEPPPEAAEVVRGQQLAEVKPPDPLPDKSWLYIGLTLALVGAGMLWQSLQIFRTSVYPVRPVEAS
jgi:cobaltochelatase CobN